MIMKREIYEMDLPHRAISVYMYLRDRADNQGRCFLSFQTIARDLKISPRAVIRGIEDLEQSGGTEQLYLFAKYSVRFKRSSLRG